MSTDETRYQLACCEITKDHIKATDGHIMGKIKHDDPSLSSLESPVYINRDQLPFIKLWLKINKRILDIDHAFTNTVLELRGLGTSTVLLTTDIKYPNVEQVIPKYQETVKIGLDADLLLALITGIKDLDKKKNTCSLEFKFTTEKDKEGRVTGYKVGTTDPFIIKCGNENLGILMPVRV